MAKPDRRWWSNPPVIARYGVAVVSVSAALVCSWWMDMYLVGSPVSLFLCAVMFSAWFGGLNPGLLATALSVLAFKYYFADPEYSLALDTEEIPRLLIFALAALFVGLLSASQRIATESLRHARDELDGAVQQLHVLSRRLFQIQEDERRHLARELHDQMGQALTALKIDLQATQRLEERTDIVRRLDDSIAALERLLQQARQLSLELRPPLLDDLGLVPALRWYLDQQAQRAGLRVEFFADPALERVDAAIETACFRVAQEALTNVVRHARAQTVSVELHRTAEALHLMVRDNGIGFDVVTAQQGASMGLHGMRERVALVGGELDCKSAPGRGTEVHAFFPVQSRADAQEPRP
jgi:signal transduction histidine kinase